MKTKQIVFTQPRVARLLEAETLPPKAGEVTVKLAFSAVSAGTEKANLLGMRCATDMREDEGLKFPRCLGYSAAGVVVEVGEGVSGLQTGDRVIVFWGVHKGVITISAHNVLKIPDEVSFEEAALAMIATFPLAAIHKARLEIGEPALAMGLGLLGQIAVEELRAAGACPVLAADPIPERRELALALGADHALDPTQENFAQQVREWTGGVAVCIESTGLGVGLIEALDCMRRFGRVALLGCTRSSKFEIDYYGKVHGPGISLIGAHTQARPKVESSPGLWTDRDDLTAVLQLLRGGRLTFRQLIHEIHAPAEAPEVYRRLIDDPRFPIGVLFDWTREA